MLTFFLTTSIKWFICIFQKKSKKEGNRNGLQCTLIFGIIRKGYYLGKGPMSSPSRRILHMGDRYISQGVQIVASIWFKFVTRPSGARAVLQTPPLLIESVNQSVSQSSFVKIPSTNLHSQTVKVRELTFWEKVHLPPPVTCQVSHVTRHMSHVTCQLLHVTCHIF